MKKFYNFSKLVCSKLISFLESTTTLFEYTIIEIVFFTILSFSALITAIVLIIWALMEL